MEINRENTVIGVSMFDCRYQAPAVTLLAIAVAFAGLHTPGAISTLVTLAPSFVGVISGVTFCLASVGSLLQPIIVKAIVTTGTHAQWCTVFRIWGSFAVLPVVFFSLWGSAEEAEWSKNAKPNVKSAPPEALTEFERQQRELTVFFVSLTPA